MITKKDLNILEQVDVIANNSTCTRRQIACIITKNGQQISSGYSGSPRKFPHCIDKGCIRDDLKIKSGTQLEVCDAVHAEQNAMLQVGKESEGATLYVNAYPCKVCARMMVNAGIKRAVVSGSYSDREGLEILKQAGIELAITEL